MRQLIARVDDDLHERLRARAAIEGRSMNALIVEALDAVAPHLDDRAGLRARLSSAGLLFEPPVPDDVGPHPRGGIDGTVSEALAAERAAR